MSNTRKSTAASKATGDAAVFDLDAARARRLESSQASVTFTWQGEEYQAPTPAEWELAVAEELAQGNTEKALQLLLGDEQYDRFMASRPRVGDVVALMEWLGSLATGSLGNS
jgi:hypothetical protein